MTNQTAETTMNENETTVLEYRIAAKGVFGRNRKAKLHTAHLADAALDAPLSDDAVKALVDAALVDLKPKAGLTWRVSVTETKVSRSTYDGHILTSRSFMMFSDKTVAQGAVAC